MSVTPARPYMMARVYCLVVGAAWNIFGLAGKPDLMVLTFPFIIPAIFMISSLGAFRFPYSAFGPLPRTPQPQGPRETVRRSGGRIGWFSATVPFITWSLYADGIGFRIVGVGSGFIPYGTVQSTKGTFLGGCKVAHTSVEVRSPVAIPSRRACREIKSGLARATV